jgi:hypothetical protein
MKLLYNYLEFALKIRLNLRKTIIKATIQKTNIPRVLTK